MKKFLLVLWLIGVTGFAHGASGNAYLARFMAYLEWSQNLPEHPDDSFFTFISEDTPLANKLRNRWLYHLAQNKDWANYLTYYKPTSDVNLQCFKNLANYYQGNTVAAMQDTQAIWLSGNSQPPGCNRLLDMFVKSAQFNEKLITARIILALDKGNLPLVRYLLKQYKKPRLQDQALLMSIHQAPGRILQLTPGGLHGEFYLYGLKRMVSINMDQALNYWQNPKTKKMLSQAQQQAFLAHLALYKAMRNHEDTAVWFAKIQPAFYDSTLLDWQIRFALKRGQWRQVEKLIQHSPEKDNPCWQYWLARAMEKQGRQEQAREIYKTLAQTRHYYGFLASVRIHKNPNFQYEKAVTDLSLLKPYKPFTDNIKSLYHSKQTLQASRLLNDFASELPKSDKSALAFWVSNTLQWHDKSLALSSDDDLNNQLSLRFPLAYHSAITEHSKNHQVPQELIYAIIRQESSFREDVVSVAGARGLMQLMPATAVVVAKLAKIPYGDKAQLFLSQKNISIGVAYLATLAKRFNRHPLLIAAAYNAGPRQVNYWLKNHPPREIDVWIDTLPWHETRNYLKNVISFYAVYQFRMQKKIDLSAFMRPLM
ncbi:transglycosylase SLT domain-containing protein [Legionella sp. MW5194]|uniref:transglycosylase SLT domain-containing protein n=1 Tax=Legionella sp. MW5194 TaxID=2662448 RepID=UPI00193DB484|nr:transglycosylase SLT domain-containing protein [Legionella sp. MW5194]QRN03349.1 transglycosylase SLT domain-containing protein [Legionella sp. MW5194]